MKKICLICMFFLGGCASVFERSAFEGQYQASARKGGPEESVALSKVTPEMKVQMAQLNSLTERMAEAAK